MCWSQDKTTAFGKHIKEFVFMHIQPRCTREYQMTPKNMNGSLPPLAHSKLNWHRDVQILGQVLAWPRSTMCYHYCDVIMGAMATQITSLTIVHSTIHSSTDQRKHQSSASLAFGDVMFFCSKCLWSHVYWSFKHGCARWVTPDWIYSAY